MTCPCCARHQATWEVLVSDRYCPDSVRGTWLTRCSSCRDAIKKYWKRVTERPLAATT